MDILRLATRQSALALWQTEHVAARLRQAHPGLTVELVPMTTQGDRILDRPLAAIGGKGLFLKELEVAMLEGRADAAVHSLKDVPMELEGPFALAAVLERADPFDAFVSPAYASLDALPSGARVGTSSLRRQALLRGLRPDLRIIDLRGNLNTRLAKLDAGDYDAIILACAGLERLGFGARIRQRLVAPDWVPAVAQGAIGIECREGDTAVAALFAPLIAPELWTGFSGRYEAVQMTMTEGSEVDLLEKLRLARIDLALTYDLNLPPDVSFIELARLRTYVIVGAGHRMAGRRSIRLAELIDDPFVLLDPPLTRDYFLGMFRKIGGTPRIVMETSSTASLRSYVAAGIGYSMMTVRPANRHAENGLPLVYLPIEDVSQSIAFGIASLTELRRSRAADAFVDYCREVIRDGALPGMLPAGQTECGPDHPAHQSS